jgi:hypothetical protein
MIDEAVTAAKSINAAQPAQQLGRKQFDLSALCHVVVPYILQSCACAVLRQKFKAHTVLACIQLDSCLNEL